MKKGTFFHKSAKKFAYIKKMLYFCGLNEDYRLHIRR